MLIPESHTSLPTPGGGTKPFWHSEPSKILLGHLTTPTLPSSTDIIIIGSGISGSLAAWSLLSSTTSADSNSGPKITLLEAREAISGATGRNGGHCAPKLYSSPSHIARFELQNFEFLRGLVRREGIDCEWQEVQSCHGYDDEQSFYPAVAAVEALKALDPVLGEQVDVVTGRSRNPSMADLSLGKETVGAVVTKVAASLWPYKLVAWVLESLLEEFGVRKIGKVGASFNLQTNTPVTRLQRVEDAWIVHTDRGMIFGKQVLLCTNAYTSALLPSFDELIVPVRGEMTALKPTQSISPATGIPLSGRNSYGFYASPEGGRLAKDDYLTQRPFSKDHNGKQTGGQLMFGGARARSKQFGVGISDDSSCDPRAGEYLQSTITQDLDLGVEGKLEAEWRWSGIMGFSRDSRPWIGAVPESLGGGEGLFLCAGFTGHGMPTAPLCALAVAKMMKREDIIEEELPRDFYISEERVENARRLLAFDV